MVKERQENIYVYITLNKKRSEGENTEQRNVKVPFICTSRFLFYFSKQNNSTKMISSKRGRVWSKRAKEVISLAEPDNMTVNNKETESGPLLEIFHFSKPLNGRGLVKIYISHRNCCFWLMLTPLLFGTVFGAV